MTEHATPAEWTWPPAAAWTTSPGHEPSEAGQMVALGDPSLVLAARVTEPLKACTAAASWPSEAPSRQPGEYT